jgi:hypothetical protein
MNKNKTEININTPRTTKATMARKGYSDSIMKNDVIRYVNIYQ